MNEGRAIFKVLCQVWSHAGISQYRKLQIFNACVTSKFLYSLDSLWFLKNDRSRIDSFQCMCLRRIAKIQPSFISRVSNADVFGLTKQEKYSTILQKQQIRLYQKVQAMSLDTPVRRLIFNDVGTLIIWAHHRKRGRPRQRWSHSVRKLI